MEGVGADYVGGVGENSPEVWPVGRHGGTGTGIDQMREREREREVLLFQ